MSRNSNKNLKALFLPDFSKNNPYLNNLADGLRKQNIDVEMSNINLRKHPRNPISAIGDFDVIHIHWTHSIFLGANLPKSIIRTMLVFLDIKKLKNNGKAIVWTVHNIWYHDRKWRWLEFLAKKKLAKLADRILVHCENARELFIENYNLSRKIAKKIEVLPHGNYIENYENKISKTSAKLELNLDTNKFIFVNIGRIMPYKGLERLIESFQRLDDNYCQLIIAGKANDKQYLKKLKTGVSPNIKIIDKFIPDDEIQILLNAADFVVLPYDKILTSGTAVLALSFGRPVIAPDIGCIKEQVGDAGIFYDNSDPDGLYYSMKIAKNIDIKRMSKMAFDTVKFLSLDKIGQQLSIIYKKSLKNE
ncbi:MAG: glycosyltransferase family 4 protein [Candidatus Zixiibacteriota bacterium]